MTVPKYSARISIRLFAFSLLFWLRLAFVRPERRVALADEKTLHVWNGPKLTIEISQLFVSVLMNVVQQRALYIFQA